MQRAGQRTAALPLRQLRRRDRDLPDALRPARPRKGSVAGGDRWAQSARGRASIGSTSATRGRVRARILLRLVRPAPSACGARCAWTPIREAEAPIADGGRAILGPGVVPGGRPGPAATCSSSCGPRPPSTRTCCRSRDRGAWASSSPRPRSSCPSTARSPAARRFAPSRAGTSTRCASPETSSAARGRGWRSSGRYASFQYWFFQ